MDAFARRDWDELAADRGPEPRISIYLRTRRTGREVRQNTIRLKNAVHEAEQQLAEQGHEPDERRRCLEPLQDLVDNGNTWSRRQLDGAALFLSPQGLRSFRIGRPADELCLVADRFHLKPMLSLLQDVADFLVLALSINQVRLFRARRDALDELDLGPIPGSLTEALGREVTEPNLKQHVGSRPSAHGGNDLIFHGHGDDSDSRNEDIERFFHRIDEGLAERFSGDRSPVVLAGVDEHLHRFRRLSKYPELVDGGVVGNADSLDHETVLAGAWREMRPLLDARRNEAAERYRELRGSGRTVADLKEVLEAARVGRVDTLFLAEDRRVWGRMPDSGEPELHDERRAGDLELLDQAAALSLDQGAPVFVCPADGMPAESPAAAVLRY